MLWLALRFSTGEWVEGQLVQNGLQKEKEENAIAIAIDVL